ncbi:hypothetical protein PILCRDRAFT_552216 [Piloderma croceum F 1598]|uniref:Uncharacterized protein n=1 Tax=Piloderma croceum (strain F 1598) TaxID=765440 RepID=A0A0C3FJN3_PILCF|nr:hypothetical protein PILCRDRAFT_552216 [Piloderma croceum F 1598]
MDGNTLRTGFAWTEQGTFKAACRIAEDFGWIKEGYGTFNPFNAREHGDGCLLVLVIFANLIHKIGVSGILSTAIWMVERVDSE